MARFALLWACLLVPALLLRTSAAGGVVGAVLAVAAWVRLGWAPVPGLVPGLAALAVFGSSLTVAGLGLVRWLG